MQAACETHGPCGAGLAGHKLARVCTKQATLCYAACASLEHTPLCAVCLGVCRQGDKEVRSQVHTDTVGQRLERMYNKVLRTVEREEPGGPAGPSAAGGPTRVRQPGFSFSGYTAGNGGGSITAGAGGAGASMSGGGGGLVRGKVSAPSGSSAAGSSGPGFGPPGQGAADDVLLRQSAGDLQEKL